LSENIVNVEVILVDREAAAVKKSVFLEGVVQAIATRHGDTPANAYRINYQGASIVFSGDVDPSSVPNLTQLAQGANLFICTCDVLDPPGSPDRLTVVDRREHLPAAGRHLLDLSHRLLGLFDAAVGEQPARAFGLVVYRQ